MRSCLDMLSGHFGVRRNKIPDKFVKKDMGEALLEPPTVQQRSATFLLTLRAKLFEGCGIPLEEQTVDLFFFPKTSGYLLAQWVNEF